MDGWNTFASFWDRKKIRFHDRVYVKFQQGDGVDWGKNVEKIVGKRQGSQDDKRPTKMCLAKQIFLRQGEKNTTKTT